MLRSRTLHRAPGASKCRQMQGQLKIHAIMRGRLASDYVQRDAQLLQLAGTGGLEDNSQHALDQQAEPQAAWEQCLVAGVSSGCQWASARLICQTILRSLKRDWAGQVANQLGGLGCGAASSGQAGAAAVCGARPSCRRWSRRSQPRKDPTSTNGSVAAQSESSREVCTE